MERGNVCYAPASIPIAITKKEKKFFPNQRISG